MNQLFIPDLGVVVGHNVARIRKERAWSQRDLIERLNEAEYDTPPAEARERQDSSVPASPVRLDTAGRWSSASLSLLENRGARGERLSDLAALCAAFGVPLTELLHGPKNLEVETQSRVFRHLGWVIQSLEGRSGTQGEQEVP